MISLQRPTYNRYALASVSDETYFSFVNGYSKVKRYGVKAAWVYISGSGVSDLCKEAMKGAVRKYGRERLATGLMGAAGYAASPLVPLISNSTKLIKFANITHTCIAYVAECCEDCSGTGWLVLDMALCGQPIPMGSPGRYNLMGGDNKLFSDFIDD